jgi:molybdopterin-containing oxidoreductase family iron-sulfur binding subunit
MVIDLGKCLSADGCKDCIDACHRIHNVPTFNKEKDEVKWLWTTSFQQGFPGLGHRYISEDIINKPALMLCNHCDDPPCVAVCPTRATWKRWDGIVMMDYHRCIGCRYCMAACPYGSRSFNWQEPRPFIKEINPEFPTRTKGVVEKCNFCQERLEDGLIPACVEACNGRGLVFGDLEKPDSEVRNIIGSTFTVRRKSSLGTEPQIYYIV